MFSSKTPVIHANTCISMNRMEFLYKIAFMESARDLHLIYTVRAAIRNQRTPHNKHFWARPTTTSPFLDPHH
ncbi:hypothetical protein XELAEV_18014666mg [Xenopus laevis]|uniref:Uncharacterized protein n=1 Tax=Xenopus laevis TaxID=8355 RepID=A0A974HV69_XENLA|nr:hypothetical protein XELAEV_18014666mg [Xenopus laevis]